MGRREKEIDDAAALASLVKTSTMLDRGRGEIRDDGISDALERSIRHQERNRVSIHAGAGGTDALDWTGMLLRMFTRFAEQHEFTVELLDESRGEDVVQERHVCGARTVRVRLAAE